MVKNFINKFLILFEENIIKFIIKLKIKKKIKFIKMLETSNSNII